MWEILGSYNSTWYKHFFCYSFGWIWAIPGFLDCSVIRAGVLSLLKKSVAYDYLGNLDSENRQLASQMKHSSRSTPCSFALRGVERPKSVDAVFVPRIFLRDEPIEIQIRSLGPTRHQVIYPAHVPCCSLPCFVCRQIRLEVSLG